MTADDLTALATGYWPAATLNAAVTLGLFDVLDETPRSAVSLSNALAVATDHLAALLDALVGLGLLDKCGGNYALAAAARPWLSRASATCLLDALAYNVDLYGRWAGLADVIRTGNPTAQHGQLGEDPAMTRRFVRGMEAKAIAFAPAIAPLIDLADARTLLDVGCGPGTLSRLLAERTAALQVTLLDLPPVLTAAAELWDASPVRGRLALAPADYRRDPLPDGFDAVLYAGAAHQETAATVAALFARIGRSLRPGGRVFVVDLMLDEGRTAPAFSALFQLNMLLIRPTARVFAVDELTALLSSAGFEDVVVRMPEASPYRVVIGRTSRAGSPAVRA